MSLRSNLATVEGNFGSLIEVIRGAAILLEFDGGKKNMDARDVQSSIIIHFSGEKLRNAINFGARKVTDFFKREKPVILPELKTKIKSIALDFGVSKITDSMVMYLDGIYENIHEYVVEPIVFNSSYDATYLIEKSCQILMYKRAKKLRDVHFDCLRRILSPNGSFVVNWNIERNWENVSAEIAKYRSDLKLTDGFYNRLISSLY